MDSLRRAIQSTSAATFNPNGGTVAFIGSGSSLSLPASFTLNNLTINKVNNNSVFFQTTSTLVTTGTVNLTDGQIANSVGIGTIDRKVRFLSLPALTAAVSKFLSQVPRTRLLRTMGA